MSDLAFEKHKETGKITSVRLYGTVSFATRSPMFTKWNGTEGTDR
jgi:hypothetical protein